jgi:hypothetical protein
LYALLISPMSTACLIPLILLRFITLITFR